MNLKAIFKREFYPSFKEEWENPENTVYREFYLTNSNDYDTLFRLVEKNMSDKGNEGVTRYRLMKLLKHESNRRFYLAYQKRHSPLTYLLSWNIRIFIETINRRLKTKKFKRTVELCILAKEVMTEIKQRENEKDSNT